MQGPIAEGALQLMDRMGRRYRKCGRIVLLPGSIGGMPKPRSWTLAARGYKRSLGRERQSQSSFTPCSE